jgi:hypothetical protein
MEKLTKVLKQICNTFYENLIFIGGICFLYWFVFWIIPNWLWDNKYEVWDAFKTLTALGAICWFCFRVFSKKRD